MKILTKNPAHQSNSAKALTTLLSAVMLFSLLGLAMPAHSAGTDAQPLELSAHVGLVNFYTFDDDCQAGKACKRKGELSGKLVAGFGLLGQSLEVMAFRIGDAEGPFKLNGQIRTGKVNETGAGAYLVLPYEWSGLTLKAKLGAGAVQTRVRFDTGEQKSRWTAQPLIGLGASYPISKELNARFEWDLIPGNYGEGRTQVGMVSAGLGYRF